VASPQAVLAAQVAAEAIVETELALVVVLVVVAPDVAVPVAAVPVAAVLVAAVLVAAVPVVAVPVVAGALVVVVAAAVRHVEGDAQISRCWVHSIPCYRWYPSCNHPPVVEVDRGKGADLAAAKVVASAVAVDKGKGARVVAADPE
jgi:hypothetical protein